MTEIDDSVTPQKVPDADPQSLDVQPSQEEFFVFSRVDGNSTVAQLCKATGLGTDKTIDCIRNLRDYGLVQLPEHDSSGSRPEAPSDNARSPSRDRGESSGSRAESSDQQSDDPGAAIQQRFPEDVDDFPFDQRLLEQSVELDEDFKREVMFVHEQLDRVNHYELLGVEQDAQRRQLRKAYFRMSKRYHPDRFYQKILGDFEPMIEAIFQRVTSAYQTLTNDRKRQEYDESLATGGSGSSSTASTPAARESAPREEMKGDQKKEMAFNVLVNRSDEALDQGDYAKAIDGYRKALSLRRDGDLALRVARRLLDAGQHLEDATSFARAAHKIDTSSPQPLVLLGRIYERKDSPDDAIYHYEQALEAGADDPEISERIARLEQ